jgi:Flp pilus assembly protein TadB
VSAAKGSRPVKPGKGKNALVVLLAFVGVCLIVFGLLTVSVRLFVPGIVATAMGALSAFGAIRMRRRVRLK